jgi:hypothetical protein
MEHHVQMTGCFVTAPKDAWTGHVSGLAYIVLIAMRTTPFALVAATELSVPGRNVIISRHSLITVVT